MEPVKDPHTRKALAASLILHIGLLLVLTRVNMPPMPPAPAMARPLQLVVSVATNNPQRASSKPETPVSIPADDSAPTLANPGQVEKSVVKKSVPIPAKSSENSNSVHVAKQSSPQETTTLDPASLQTAIEDSVSTFHLASLKSGWTEPCKQYRPQLEHDNCPPDEESKTAKRAAIDHETSEVFLTWAHAKERDQSRAKELQTEMDRWQPLMSGNPVVSKIASENYYLAKAKRDYVNEKLETAGGMIPLVGFDFGENKIVFLAGLLTISLDGKVTVNDEQHYGPARSANERK